MSLKLFVVELDQLVAKSVHVSTKATLPWQNIIIVVKAFEQEWPIGELLFGVVVVQVVSLEFSADRRRLVRLIRLFDVPEFAADFIADARASQKLVVALKVDFDAIETFAVVHDVLRQILINHSDYLTGEHRIWLQVLVQVQ